MSGIAALFALGALVVALIALGSGRSAEAELRYLRRRVEALEGDLRQLRTAPPPPEQAPEAAPEPEPEPGPEPVFPAAMAEPPPARPAAPKEPAFEQVLTENWLVWLGGITLALGGAFLVKYSFDMGWLGPTVRVVLGVLLGLGLVAGGHRLAVRQPNLSFAGLDPSHVPPALVGAGSSIAFASLYAAYALYDLIPPLAAFAALALVAAGTVLLALTHGPYVALLGLLGGHAVPLLIQTGRNDAVALFAYLLLVNAGALALLRWKAWWWLAWVSLGASVGWVLLWLAGPYRAGDELALGLFLVAMFGLCAALRRGIPGPAWLSEPVAAPELQLLVQVAGLAAAATLLLIVLAADHGTGALVVAFLYFAAVLAVARMDAAFDALPFAAAALGLLILVTWEVPSLVLAEDLLRRPLPEHAHAFSITAALSGALFASGGFAALWGAPRPGRWATLSAATPVLTLVVAYWTLSRAGIDLAWAAGALALGGVLLAAGERTARWRSHPGMEAALGAYAVGVLAAVALAATIALEEAWLTVTLALLLPGIAWVEGQLRILGLRRVALLVAGAVLVRLALNPYVLDYPIGAPIANWLLYGYGLPLAAFAGAAWMFRRGADDVLVQVLEGGAVLFLVLLVSLEIRHLMAGSLQAYSYGLAEQSLHSLAWLGIAVGLGRAGHRITLRWASWLLIGLATAQILLLQVMADNPWLTNRPVGEWMLVNVLLLAYALPAALYALLYRLDPPPPWLRQLCGVMALLLTFLWLTLEVRHFFTGPRLGRAPVSDTELYTYSVAWLLYAGALLAAGLRWKSQALRHAGLAMLLLEVLKVFLIDMAGLTGLWRALSFLALGGALVGVGYLFRRFVRDQGPAGQTAGPQCDP